MKSELYALLPEQQPAVVADLENLILFLETKANWVPATKEQFVLLYRVVERSLQLQDPIERLRDSIT